MKLFEIHITGEKSIMNELRLLGLKGIVIDLLKPDETVLRTEYMSSIAMKFDTFGECVNWVQNLVAILEKAVVKIIRVKIESPYYEEYVPLSLYIESHWTPNLSPLTNYGFPISRNQGSRKLMATSREYNKDKFKEFVDKSRNTVVELCLLDSFKEEDKD